MLKLIFRFLSKLPKKMRVKLLDKIVKHFIKKYCDLKIIGMENIPESGAVIFISNHLSNADGLILNSILKEVKKVYFLAGVKLEEEVATKVMLDLVPHIKINPNKPDRQAIRKSVETLKEGNSILVFPEGTRSRTGKMLKGRSGVSLIAKLANVPIIPIGISGTEKLLPINPEGKMGNEGFVNARVNVGIGEAFDLKDLETEENSELVHEMMQKIADLVPTEYKGYYE